MDELKKQVQVIVESDVKNKWDHFCEIYIDAFKRYPKLMKMACEVDDVDNFFRRFSYFLNMKESIDVKERTADEADVEVGQHLADAYLPKK